jgi:hypothetical protein
MEESTEKNTYALLKDGIIENIVLGYDEESIRFIIPKEYQIIKQTEDTGICFFGGTFLKGRFIKPAPYESWIFDEEKWDWVAPKEIPEELIGEIVIWDENKKDWVLIN